MKDILRTNYKLFVSWKYQRLAEVCVILRFQLTSSLLSIGLIWQNQYIPVYGTGEYLMYSRLSGLTGKASDLITRVQSCKRFDFYRPLFEGMGRYCFTGVCLSTFLGGRGRGLPTLDRGGVPTLDWGRVHNLERRGVLPLMGRGIPTLDGGMEYLVLMRVGYLPWMGKGTYLGWGRGTYLG